jgi:Ran GTPase-activating protein (RanGAP) involved in mRNA processing and transport
MNNEINAVGNNPNRDQVDGSNIIPMTSRPYLDVLEKLRKNESTFTILSAKSNFILHNDYQALGIIKALRSNTCIADLIIDNSWKLIGFIGYNALAEYIQATKNIKRLFINMQLVEINFDCFKILIHSLKQNTSITMLHIVGNTSAKMQVELFDALSHNTNLIEYIHKGEIDKDCDKDCTMMGTMLEQALMRNKSLKRITFRSTTLGDKMIARFANGLVSNNTLTKVCLTSCIISDYGIRSFMDAFNNGNKSISILCLAKTKLSEISACHIAQILSGNESVLQALDLEGCAINSIGICAIAQAMRQNQSITELILEGNSVSLHAAHCIANVIRYNSTLKKLDISFCAIGNDEVAPIAKSLHWNTSMVGLDLAGNNISDIGIAFIGNAVRYHSTLEKIGLNGNPTSNVGVTHIISALEQNETLQVVGLPDFIWNEKLEQELKRLAKSNDTIKRLWAYGYKSFFQVSRVATWKGTKRRKNMFCWVNDVMVPCWLRGEADIDMNMTIAN